MTASGNFLVPQGPGAELFPLVIVLVWIVIAGLVGADASRRGDSPVAWALVALLLGPIGWLLYLVLRRSPTSG